jgi:HSP20 family protein
MYALSRPRHRTANTNSGRSTDALTNFTRDFFGFDPFTGQRNALPRFRSPRFDFLESPQEYTLRGDLPGVPEEKLEVTVHEGVLVIKGNHTEEALVEDSKFLVRERRFGEFERRLNLPKDADPGQVEAKLNNGVLNISIATKEELKARKIEIG